jgi:sec-independent protein translocase protein TatA
VLKDIGPMELVIVLVIVLLIFGAGKLPSIGGALGKSIREFKREKDGVADKPAGTPVVQATTAQSSPAEEKKAT